MPRCRTVVTGVVGVLVAVTGAACSSVPSFDRAAAVDRVVGEAGGRITRQQAECYVDRVQAELGTGVLTSGSAPPVDLVPKLTRIRIDCTGLATLGTDAPRTTSATVDPILGSEPQRPGDDAELDVLHQACAATGGAACDQLFDRAPPGSEYEEFASTCGGRTKELVCAERYPDSTAPVPVTTTTAAPKR